MKSIFTLSLLACVAAGCVTGTAQAQNFKPKNRYTSLGVSLNASNYFGDVVPEVSFGSMRLGASRPGLGLTATQRLTSRVSVRAALTYGRLVGSDSKASSTDADAKYRNHRNINFRNDLLELSAVGIFDLVPNYYSFQQRPSLVPYVFGGVAVFHHNPKGLVEGGTIPASLREGRYVALQPLQTEGQEEAYSRTQFALPFGVGLRYRINQNLDINLEVGWRKTFTDYLDDVSGNYTSMSNLRTDAARYFGHDVTLPETDRNRFPNFNAPGSTRGKSNNQDWYIISGISVNYILPTSVGGSKFR
jgi:opacity protein-like surface antigen